ncbi:MAG: KUP/HAK/KT family potassium transporter [Candidatus Gastranaerophilales bacterium]|nr:KUP/HAK/KT family potassium transporter [Candidatus Gastranaerophilales bacterium]
MSDMKAEFSGIVKSLGLVFGDIGTSPIYTFTVIFLLLPKTMPNIVGVLSLIIWTLILIVSLEYAWLAMSLSKKGEGGTIVLRETLLPLLKSGKQVAVVTFLTYVAISLIMGDGVITPAISILSAVEGMLLIPGFEYTPQIVLISIAAVIAVLLFVFQKNGADKVAGAFGPIMLVWFIVLGLTGLVSVIYFPEILKAINPYYGIKFLMVHGMMGFFVLSEVLLCATGTEALYADMGHLGRWPIIKAWYFVLAALLLCYMGQGAFLIQNTKANNILFEMIFNQVQILYVPFLILSIIATIIASQAMISGMFSIAYQGITTRILPMFKVDYTSVELRSQIYIGFINWFLLIFVLLVMFIFKKSSNLAAAYGMAVAGTMTVTGTFITMIFYFKKKKALTLLAFSLFLVNVSFLVSTMYKIPHGGYISLAIAAIPLCIITIYTSGQKLLYNALNPMDLDEFLPDYSKTYKESYRIRGTALYFARNIRKIPPYIVRTMFVNNIIYEDNIIVSINQSDQPYGITPYFKETLAEGLRKFQIDVGYMEVINLEEILDYAGIHEKVIFYGLEEISTDNPVWRIFSIIKKLTPAFVQFYELPSYKLHGVITRIEI